MPGQVKKESGREEVGEKRISPTKTYGKERQYKVLYQLTNLDDSVEEWEPGTVQRLKGGF